jgi:hyperosmotically inducible periplasmic protein
MNKLIVATTGIAIVLLASACDRTTTATRTEVPPASTSGTMPQPADAVSDTAVTAKVKAALAAADGVSGTKISVETQAGRVTLKGRLADQAMIDRAVATAQGVEGVKRVENQLAVGSS